MQGRQRLEWDIPPVFESQARFYVGKSRAKVWELRSRAERSAWGWEALDWLLRTKFHCTFIHSRPVTLAVVQHLCARISSFTWTNKAPSFISNKRNTRQMRCWSRSRLAVGQGRVEVSLESWLWHALVDGTFVWVAVHLCGIKNGVRSGTPMAGFWTPEGTVMCKSAGLSKTILCPPHPQVTD